MSGRFISGGTIGAGEDTEAGADTGSINRPADGPDAARKAAEWDKVQQQLDADRRRRAQAAAAAAGGEERSLYDVLQSNKAAKEAAAAEASKLTNQIRALDDDEVAFLDEVRARRRAEEESVRRETEEGLKKFRRQSARREDGRGVEQEEEEEGESWGTRKRKRGREREGGKGMGVVRRRVASGAEEGKKDGEEETKTDEKKIEEKKIEEKRIEEMNMAKSGEEQLRKKTALALVDYGSDSDD
ncbi:hypothetical protein ACQRIT_005598 [Beauveria bassiana]